MANLTGKELVDLGIITGSISAKNIAQHGVDLNVISIEKIIGQGQVLIDKTVIPQYESVPPIFKTIGDNEDNLTTIEGWEVSPGMYNITFEQGCDIPKNQRMFIVQRSSMMRGGVILNSSMFDAGFKTSQMGTFICVFHPIFIECGARVAQAYTEESNEVQNLYKGQFQGDSQRRG